MAQLYTSSEKQLKLRDYQQEAVDKFIESASNRAKHAGLIVMPTGTGKTIVGAEIVRRFREECSWRGQHVLIVCHRTEILLQWLETLARFGIDAAGYSGMLNASYENVHSSVKVATVQTLMSRGDKLPLFDYTGLVLLDETHHSAAKTWLRTIIKAQTKNRNCYFLGMTATPFRGDGRSIYKLFGNNVVYQMTLLDAVDEGWLVPISQQFVELSDFKPPRNGEVYVKQLLEHMKMPTTNQRICSVIADLIRGKQTIVFCGDVQHAYMVSEVLADLKIKNEFISAKTDREHRLRVMNDFKNGEVNCLVNCNIYTEGYDAAPTQCIVMLRPTKSALLYTQMVGRGLRPLPGSVDGLDSSEERKASIAQSAKPEVLIADVVGNCFAHKLATAYDMVMDVSKHDIGKFAERLLSVSKDNGVRTSRKVSLSEGVRIITESPEFQAQGYEAVNYSLTKVDPFSGDTRGAQKRMFTETPSLAALRAIESYLRDPMNPPRLTWRPATSKQCSFLNRYGLVPAGMTAEDMRVCVKLASLLIGETLRRWRNGLPSIAELAHTLHAYPNLTLEDIWNMDRSSIWRMLKQAGIRHRIYNIPNGHESTTSHHIRNHQK